MWCPSLSGMGRATVAGLFLLAAGKANACLFPCFFGWGGYYGPPPAYAAPAYAAPAYAPSPCGPGGCSPCGPGGCSSYYGPTACCSSCCDSGCSGGNCVGENCGANYGSDLKPTPDQGPKKKTYSSDPAETENEKPPTPADMEDDDFKEPLRDGATSTGGTGDAVKKEDPFKSGTAGENAAPAAEPVPADILPDMSTLRVLPTRSRTDVHAQYRLPRVARLHVEPRTDWLPAAEGRLARR